MIPPTPRKTCSLSSSNRYAAVTGKPLESVTRWVEKTPANRNHFPAILKRFPHAKILLTLRDPRAILSTQIALEKQRRRNRLSVYYCVNHWLHTARLASQAISGEHSRCCLVVPYEKLVEDPAVWMKKVCSFLEIEFSESVLDPTKAGRAWSGNSAVESPFTSVNAEPARRWESDLSADEIGWVEWHCRELMPQFGYEPRLERRELRHWLRPIRLEKPKQFLKSRFYSLRDQLTKGAHSPI